MINKAWSISKSLCKCWHLETPSLFRKVSLNFFTRSKHLPPLNGRLRISNKRMSNKAKRWKMLNV